VTEFISGGSSIMIEKNAVFGELLYVGLVFEKGRYRSNGIWKYAYSKSFKKNISLLREIAQCMQKEFKKEEDNIFIRKIYNEIKCDNILTVAYPFNKVINDTNMENFIITDCNNENKHIKIIIFINKLLEDVLFELDRGLKKDKEKIGRLLFSLHNLPRVYLDKEAYTLCSLGQEGITVDNALEYSKMSMSKEMLSNYKSLLLF
jgi:hypothetical protein